MTIVFKTHPKHNSGHLQIHIFSQVLVKKKKEKEKKKKTPKDKAKQKTKNKETNKQKQTNKQNTHKHPFQVLNKIWSLNKFFIQIVCLP